ncbi:peptidase [Caudoviricetes sp.]|nr:peptidase [Caudoviricetes sp.]UOF81488.1 peptidase [Caudoviricetes sp.]
MSAANRLKTAMDKANIKSAALLSRLTKLKDVTVRAYANGTRNPPLEECFLLAKALKVDPFWLFSGKARPELSNVVPSEIPVLGYAGAREVVNIIPSDDQGPIDEVQPLRAEDGFRAVIVHGSSMLPAFRDGDVLFFREDHVPIDQLIGRDCIILTDDKERAYVKRIMKGSKKGHYTLLSYAPGIDPLPDVKVLKAWPIEWIRRK